MPTVPMVLAAPVLNMFMPSCFVSSPVDAGKTYLEQNLRLGGRNIDV